MAKKKVTKQIVKPAPKKAEKKIVKETKGVEVQMENIPENNPVEILKEDAKSNEIISEEKMNSFETISLDQEITVYEINYKKITEVSDVVSLLKAFDLKFHLDVNEINEFHKDLIVKNYIRVVE